MGFNVNGSGNTSNKTTSTNSKKKGFNVNGSMYADVVYEIKLSNNLIIGNLSYGATKAIESNTLDSYKPKNEAEKKSIYQYRLATSAEVKKDDGTSLGFITQEGLKAIAENNTKNYQPINDDEKKAIDSYVAYATQKRKEKIDNYKATATEALIGIEEEKSDVVEDVRQLNREKNMYNRGGSVSGRSKWQTKDTRTAAEKRSGVPMPKSEGATELASAKKDLETINKEAEAMVDTINNIDKYATLVYGDTGIIEQSKANYTKGRLSQDTAQAYSDYISSPTDANRMRADTLSALAEEFAINNKDALTSDDEDIGKFEETVRDWVAVSFAGYMPQFFDQTKASIKGAIGGGAYGALVGSAVPGVGTMVGAAKGAKAGWVAGASQQMYETTRGMVFKTLIDAGYDEKTALEAANDEALISSIIEGAGEIFTMSTLGTGKIFSKLVPGAAKKITSNTVVKGIKGFVTKAGTKISKNVILKATTSVAGVALNAAGEYAEEYAQEAVSIANERRLKNPNASGKLNLVDETISLLRNMDAETEARLDAAGREGFRIGLMMGGVTKGGMAAYSTASDHLSNLTTGAKIKKADANESGLVQSVIDIGLQQPEKSKTHKLATKLNTSEKQSAFNVGKLSKAIKGETVNVGETYYDTKSKSYLNIVARDDNTTTVTLVTSDGLGIAKEFSNEAADRLMKNNRYVMVANDAQTVVEQTTPTAETPSVETPTIEDTTIETPSETNEIITNVRNIITGEVLTSGQIDSIISNTESKSAFTQITGVEIKGSKAEQRAIVRNWYNNNKNAKLNATEDTNVATTESPVEAKSNGSKSDAITDFENMLVAKGVDNDSRSKIMSYARKIQPLLANKGKTLQDFYDGVSFMVTDSMGVSETSTDEQRRKAYWKAVANAFNAPSNTSIDEHIDTFVSQADSKTSVVVDAIEATLKDGAKEVIFEAMEKKGFKGDIGEFASKLREHFETNGNIDKFADYFNDNGQEVVFALERTMDTAKDTTKAPKAKTKKQTKKTTSENKKATDETKYSLSSMGFTFFGKNDVSATEVETMLEDGSYKEHQGYKDYVKNLVNVYMQSRGITKLNEATKAKAEIERQIEGLLKVAIASKRAGFDIFDDGSDRVAKDSEGRLLGMSLEPNSDYFTSSDISTICDKTKNFTDIYEAIIKKETELNVPKGKRFFDNVDNFFILHKIMAEKGLTIPCEECYVQSMRRNLLPMAEAFIELVTEEDSNNKDNKQLYDKGKIKPSNAKKRETVREICSRPDALIKLEDLSVDMLTSAEGLARIKLQSPELYQAFNSFYGQSKPKLPREAVPFRPGELIALLTNHDGTINKTLVETIKSTGGFRLQSYSDFQIQNFTDVLQTIFEASMVGLNGHAYTKVPAFLEVTDGTNLKRNISIFMYEDDGKYEIDKKNSFPMELEDIYALVAKDESGNTSIIAVSQNADMSAWIMANDLVGYGIPWHASGVKLEVVRGRVVKTSDGREVLGYANQQDHTSQQSEVWKTTNGKHKENTKVSNPINIYKFWDFENKDNLSKNELIEKNLKEYINRCNQANYRPKFRELLMDNEDVLSNVLSYAKKMGFASQDATIDDISFQYDEYRIPYGYYKFLGDFGMFKPNGTASPIETLSLENYDFDKAVKFFDDSKTLRENELLQQFENGKVRESYRKMVDNGDLTTEQLVDILRAKRNEVVRNVVDGEMYSVADEETEITKEPEINGNVEHSLYTDEVMFSSRYNTISQSQNTREMYDSAKKGNVESAYELLSELLKEDALNKIKSLGNDVYLMPIVGEEGTSKNVLPSIIAKYVSVKTGQNIFKGIYKRQSSNSRNKTVWKRMKENYPSFGIGENANIKTRDIEGKLFVLIDDNSTTGRTFVGLRNFLEENGGKVVGYYALTTGQDQSEKMITADETWNKLLELGLNKVKDFAEKEGVKREISKLGLTEREAQELIEQFRGQNTDSRRGDEAFTGSGNGNGKIREVYEEKNANGREEQSNEVKYSLSGDSYAPTFYSHMSNTIDGMKDGKHGANSVVPYLKGKGVKDEEIKWSGIEAFLEGKKSVTKEELQEFAQGSQLQIEETVLDGETSITIEPQSATLDGESMDLYVMRGGEIYDSLTWDEFNGTWESDSLGYTFDDEDQILEYYGVGKGGTRWGQYKLDGGENYREVLFKIPDSTYTNQAMQTHWGNDAEGILAHARVQDFEVEGKKMLFIEEIQSDWHNQGHNEGYNDVIKSQTLRKKAEVLRTKNRAERAEIIEELAKHYEGKVDNPVNAAKSLLINIATDGSIRNFLLKKYEIPNDLVERMKAYDKAKEEEAELFGQAYDLSVGVKDAPFKDNYHEYVLKSLIRMAAEQGYDSIGWTTADIQSKRWSNEFAEGYRIEYDQDIPKFLNKYGKKWGAKVGQTEIGGEDNDFYTVEGDTVWSMPISDAMKQSVLYEGQALYSTIEGEENSNERREDLLSGNGRRGNNESTRKLSERISSFKQKNQGRPRKERQSFSEELLGNGNAREVIDGKDKYTLVNPDAYNDDMLAMVEEAKTEGIEVGFFIGNAKIKYDTKDEFKVNGIRVNDKKILVRYDGILSPQVLLLHEKAHAKWNTSEMQSVKDTILNSLSEDEKKQILSQERYKRYMIIYKGKKEKVWEEFVADTLSGMNEYTAEYIDVVTDYWYGSESKAENSPSTYAESIDAGGKDAMYSTGRWTTDRDDSNNTKSKMDKVKEKATDIANKAIDVANKIPGVDIDHIEGKQANIADIVQMIKDSFNVPISTGKVTAPNARGIYKVQPEAIRTTIANNLPTISHELGHHLDKMYNLRDLDSVNELQQADSMQAFLSQYPADQVKGEAVAEFVRTYLRNTNEAKDLCYDFYNDFVKTLSKDDLRAVDMIANVSNEYMASTFSERVQSSIVSGNQKEKTTLSEKAKKMHADWIDGFSAIKDVTEYVEEKTGISLDGRRNAYTLATNSRNAAAIANFNVVHGFRNINGNIVQGAKSFIECIADVNKKDLETFDEYLVLKHSLEWIAPEHGGVTQKRVFGDDTLEDVDAIKQRIAEIEKSNPEMKQASENLYEYQRNMLKHIVLPAGGMTANTFQSLYEKYPCYVPFYRAVGDNKSAKTKGTFANQKSPLKRAKGSGELIISPLESIINNTDKMVKFALRNQTMQVLANYANTVEGFGQFIEKVPPDMLPHITDITQMKETFENELQQVVSSSADYFAVSDLLGKVFNDFVIDYTPKANANKKIVTVLNGGKFSYYQVHDNALYEAIAEFTPQQLEGVWKVSHDIMQVMKLLITQNNPVFGATNAVRDIGTAYKHSSINNPIEFAKRYAVALKEVVTRGESYKQWQAMGGGHNSELSANIDQLKIMLRQVSEKDMGKARRLLSAIVHPVATIASLNDYIESTPRLMEFMRTLESGGDLQKAIFNADDITTNFKKSGKGIGAKQVNAAIMFNNAALQGLNKAYRTLTNKNTTERNKTLLKWALSALFMTAIQMAWNSIGGDDDDYENLSSYKKNSFYNFAIGDGKFISIPKARETALLDSFTERTIELVFGNEDAFYEFGTYALDQLLPPMLPNTLHPLDAVHDVAGSTVLGGIMDVGWNKNYMDVPIESAYDKYLPSNERYNEKTSALAYNLGQSKLARKMDLSPKKIDHLISSYTGIIGQANRALFPKNESSRDVTMGLRNKFVSDSNYSTDILNKLYDNKDKALLEWQYDNNVDNAIEYEQNSVITSYVSEMNNAIKALPEDKQRDGRKYLLKTLNNWNYDLTTQQQRMQRNLKGESVGRDYIFDDMPSSKLEWSVNKQKYTYQMTPQEYDQYITTYLKAIEAARKQYGNNSLDGYAKAKEAAKDYMAKYKKGLTAKYQSKATKVTK